MLKDFYITNNVLKTFSEYPTENGGLNKCGILVNCCKVLFSLFWRYRIRYNNRYLNSRTIVNNFNEMKKEFRPL